MVESGLKWLKVEDGGDKMFLGEYPHTLDAKGRIILPAKFREGLGKRFFITRGLDKCLFVYAPAEWETLYEKVKGLPVMDKGVRRFERFFFSGAYEAEPDAQGRVTLPPNLRSYADVKKEVLSMGVSNRIEIWSKEIWNAYSEEWNDIDNELAERMALLGI